MPLYEIESTGELVPFQRLRAGAELYEREIADLVASKPDAFLGEPLFLVRQQAILLPGGLRPDIVALDKDGRVVILEITHDFDREGLSQILEYAGWARATNVGEISAMYHRGRDSFFPDWQEFTASDAPLEISSKPRLVLVAPDFQGPTRSTFDFLVDNGLPIRFVPVSLYEDGKQRRFLEIEAEDETEPPRGRSPAEIGGTALADLVTPAAEGGEAATERVETAREQVTVRARSANTIASDFVLGERPAEPTDAT